MCFLSFGKLYVFENQAKRTKFDKCNKFKLQRLHSFEI